MFDLANKFNVASVNQLWTNAGQPTAAYDPRQFQFALKVNWKEEQQLAVGCRLLGLAKC
jgi:hypothetical protein